MGIWEGVKRASKAVVAGVGPAEYLAAGKKIICEHCGHTRFHEGEALLNTVGMTFLKLDWANKTATTLMCDTCGRIYWYGVRPDPV
jgi:hypothetical protein